MHLCRASESRYARVTSSESRFVRVTSSERRCVRVTSLIGAVLFSVLVTWCTTPVESSVCSYSHADINQCAGQLLATFTSSGLEILSSCSTMVRVNECMDRTACAGDSVDMVSAIWFGIRDAMNYTCTRAREYEQHYSCLSRAESSLKLCSQQTGSQNTAPTEQDVCNNTNSAIKCIWKTSVEICGADTAIFVHEFTKRVYQPMLSNMNCVISTVEDVVRDLTTVKNEIVTVEQQVLTMEPEVVTTKEPEVVTKKEANFANTLHQSSLSQTVSVLFLSSLTRIGPYW